MLKEKRGTKTRTERPTATATADALLGVLSMVPMSGYTLRSVIAQSIGNFWSESYGQIYPALKRLTAEGLVEKKTERQKGRPDRNVYSLTSSGTERLKRWLEVPATTEVPRNDLLLKLFFGVHAPVSASRRNVAEFVAGQEAALERYAAIAKDLERKKKDNEAVRFWLMTLSYGRHHSTAMVAWGRETLRELDAIEKQGRKRSTAKKRSGLMKR
jgi:DNA-binding PadR family transcriptional regulator